MTSSVERFGRYANWSGSSVLGRLVLMLCMINLSKHFIMIGSVLWDGSHLDRSFLWYRYDCCGFETCGTTAWLSEVLKISVRTSVSCAAQSFSTQPGMLSGPAALRGLILDRFFLTSVAGDRQSAWSLGGVGSFCAGVSFCIQTVNKSG